ncbi:MAG: sodium:calcium antiporter, partial [Alphaproteobacteria bacterium]|nr:sodium:calcium antiporter [Alphaproteobacteria bacterium]
MAYLLAALGLALLIGGGDVLVRGAATLAHRLKVPSMLVGMTIVACGTSAPELVISLDAAVLEGVPEMALGNAVGSNIANVLLVLGVPALLAPIRAEARMAYRDTLAMLGTTVIFILLCLTGQIGWLSGILLVVLLIAFLTYSVRAGQQHASIIAEEMAELERDAEDLPSPWMPAVFVVLGIAGLIIGSRLFVSGAIQAARDFGVSEAVIGLSMVAIGTPLPELAT